MTTFENINIQPPNKDIGYEAKRRKAEEAVKRLKAKIQRNIPYITKPELGEFKKLWFDVDKAKDDVAPDEYHKTKENPNPTRDVVVWTVKTEDGQEKTFQLTPNESVELYTILGRKGGSSWIEVGRERTIRGGTKLTFLAL